MGEKVSDQSNQSSAARVLRPAHSVAALAKDGSLRRLPRAPGRARSDIFTSRFEDRIVFYDCFHDETGQHILLVGPPPFNLEPYHDQAVFTALPSGQILTASRYPSRSTMLTILSGAPSDTDEVRIAFADQQFTLAVQPNLSADLAGSKLMFTMSKDNALVWIETWARWHVEAHQVDTIVFFDNGSTKPDLSAVEACLAAVPGLKTLVMIDWPYRYGATDKGVIMHRFWAQFLQVSAMNLVLRRFGARADGILNCDIDELVSPSPKGDLFDQLRSSEIGYVQFAGVWVETHTRHAGTAPEARTHFDYTHVERTFLRHLSPAKWAIDPRRDWVRALDVFPYMHDVKYPPAGVKPVRGKFWHFKGINSNWKSKRRIDLQPNWIRHSEPADLLAARDFFVTRTAK